MGERSRKRRRLAGSQPRASEAQAPASGSQPRASGAQRRSSAAQQRDDEARAALAPLAPGERPTPITVGAIVAGLLAVANLLAYFVADVEVRGQASSAFGTVLLAVILLVAAAGMWRSRYWAVLGFQALLALTILIAGLSLVVASNLAAVALCVAIVGLGGWLFWKLVRALARLQMPERRAKTGDV